MQDQAIEKLRAEITGSNNPVVQVIGQFLLQHLEQNPDDAASILHADKTIAKSLDAMRKAAEKKKVGSMAVLTDAEGFAIVLDYFKTEAPAENAATAAPGAPPTEVQRPPGKPNRSRKKPDPKPQPEPEPEESTPDEEPAEPEQDEDEDIDFDALLL